MSTRARVDTIESEFYSAIEAFELDKKNFAIRPAVWPKTAKPSDVGHDLLVVRCESTNIEIAYPTTVPVASLFMFINDLDTGAFRIDLK